MNYIIIIIIGSSEFQNIYFQWYTNAADLYNTKENKWFGLNEAGEISKLALEQP